jgi:hypothetical protein
MSTKLHAFLEVWRYRTTSRKRESTEHWLTGQKAVCRTLVHASPLSLTIGAFLDGAERDGKLKDWALKLTGLQQLVLYDGLRALKTSLGLRYARSARRLCMMWAMLFLHASPCRPRKKCLADRDIFVQ